MENNPNTKFIFGLLLIIFLYAGCKKWAEVEAPITSTNAENAYQSDATAISVLTGIYAKLSTTNDLGTISVNAGLLADELTLWDINNANYQPFYQNQLNANPSNLHYWNKIYPYLYIINSALEGLNKSGSLSLGVKNQLLGEARFLRAFCLFYLTNLYGDVPIVLTSDYKINAILRRSPQVDVYEQIISDLQVAKAVLRPDFANISLTGSTEERVRPNKYAASALLARTELFTGDFQNAEIEATIVIDDKILYDTVPTNQVFLKNSKEAIWQIPSVFSGIFSNTFDGRLFILPAEGPSTTFPIYLSKSLTSQFELDDLRKRDWTGTVTVGQNTYEFATKYKAGTGSTSSVEYLMVLRLAEQYLIRAQARVELGNINGALQDLNLIRQRAGLASTTATTQEILRSAILKERQVELFTEWGHRWFDLKRTGTINQTMLLEAPKKSGASWNANKALFPVPITEFGLNPNLKQNPGY